MSMRSELAPTQHAPVLVVDSDVTFTRRVQQSLEAGLLLNPVIGSVDFRPALNYLAGLGEYADRSVFPLPTVIVASVELPHRQGQRLLRAVRQNLAVRHIPVVVVGSGDDEDEVSEALRLGATAYLARPVASSVLLDVIRGLNMPWSFSGLRATS